MLAGCIGRGDPEPPTPAEDQAQAQEQGPTFVDDVAGVTWEWIGFTSPAEQLTVEQAARYTIQFDLDGFTAVEADCNRGQANYFIPAAGQIALHGLSVTRAECPAGSLSQRFVSLLELVRSFYMESGNLMLELPGDSGTLRFQRRG
jgi:heat shock protein HslJ